MHFGHVPLHPDLSPGHASVCGPSSARCCLYPSLNGYTAACLYKLYSPLCWWVHRSPALEGSDISRRKDGSCNLFQKVADCVPVYAIQYPAELQLTAVGSLCRVITL
ncbi:hypothetical protein XENTR_v10010954 [Xenopus tropicalis]|nr:hypothetical protein XENTR_v10010954 [Xenopus tropicalis]KAE8606986.1 hypothetical protein XENTR_v10010954 [Xenopus tropicalis]